MAYLPDDDSHMRKAVVLYHRACNDGIAAAWAAYSYLGEDAQYIAWQYGDKIPDLAGKEVYLVDLSFTHEQIQQVRDVAKFIMIIDHHKSAIDDLVDRYPTRRNISDFRHMRKRSEPQGVFIYLDIEMSGGVLAWRFFNDQNMGEDTEVHAMPEVLRYIQDYDLWKHKIENAKPLNSWLINGPLTIQRFDSITGFDGKIRADVIEMGRMLMGYDDKIIRSVIGPYPQMVNVAGHWVPFVNAPHHLRNEIGDQLGKKYPFVVLYTERAEKTIYSLRSSDPEVDVSVLAKLNGGGGHKSAAAFAMDHGWLETYKHARVFGTPTWKSRIKAAWNVLRGK